MEALKKIHTALISVYDKNGLDAVVKTLDGFGITIYSTGGTYNHIREMGIDAIAVENLTSYPSILGGRVKTLHPKIFGGILGRRENKNDREDFAKYDIPEIDLVIVDLYPFEKTVASTDHEAEIIEKIDIGGISLIRAAAKNFRDVLIIPSVEHYSELVDLLNKNQGGTTLEERRFFATHAFNVSSHYDVAIFSYFNNKTGLPVFKQSMVKPTVLRYGENPHQEGMYFGDTGVVFDQLAGKAISYNNIGDIDAAINLISEFGQTTFAILKHNNACGVASRQTLKDAWMDALAGDPISAFGGVLITNREVDTETAAEIDHLFFEVIIAPGYSQPAIERLNSKKTRIILKQKPFAIPDKQFRSALNGVLQQRRDLKEENAEKFQAVTKLAPDSEEIADLLFANIIVKHSKSNAIVIAKNKQLLASGIGQTSRVDAMKQAIAKAHAQGFDTVGAVVASDAFFPFSDSLQYAHEAGITSVIQPGGSIRDQESIDFCNDHHMKMVFTAIRHFKH